MTNAPLIQLIQELDARRMAAMLAKDTLSLKELLAERLVYVHSTGVVDSKKSYLEGLTSGIWDYHKLSASGHRYEVHDKTVLVFCRLAIEISVKGVFKSFESNALLVWVVTESGWQLAAVQSSSIPVSVQ